MTHTIRVERADKAFVDFTKDTPWTEADVSRLKSLNQVTRFIDNKVVFVEQMNKELEQAGLSVGKGEFQGVYRSEADYEDNRIITP
jgi:hypothetical protein